MGGDRVVRRVCVVAVCGLVLVFGAGCGSSGGDDAARPAAREADGQGGNGDAAEPGDPRPGTVAGVVTDAEGRPLEGAEVRVLGNANDSGEDANYFPTTKADGSYSVEVPRGTYTVSALYEAPFEGQKYSYPLFPEDEDATLGSADDGMVVNFTWRISGPRPGADEGDDEPEHQLGGEVGLDIADVRNESFQTQHFAEEFPDGFTATVTFTPDGPLIDGSDGEVIETSHEVTSKFDAEWTHGDIPVGTYTVTAEIERPDGTTAPLQVVGIGPVGPELGEPAQSGNLVFEPDSVSGGVSRKMLIAFVYGPPYDPVS